MHTGDSRSGSKAKDGEASYALQTPPRVAHASRLGQFSSPQHITYNEWLPIVLGTDFMAELDILPVTYGYNNKYDEKVNPTITNVFAAAAFRFGHTLVQGMLE